MVQPLKSSVLKPFGAVVDLDLSRDLQDDTIAALRALFHEQHLLIFRNQDLTREQQERALGYFAPLIHEDLPLVSNATADAGLGKGQILFHSDLAFVEEPLHAISLHALEVANGETSTRFINGNAVYESLPASLKERIAPLHGLNWLADDSTQRLLTRNNDRLPRAIHPLVKEDPTTHLPVLYVSYLETIGIPELGPEEGEALIQELHSYLYRPENEQEHFWCEGDCVIWNNIVLQHARGDVSRSPRILQRASAGTRTVAEQRPAFADADIPYSARPTAAVG